MCLVDEDEEEAIRDVGEPVILIGYSHEYLTSAVDRLTRWDKRIILAGMDADNLSNQISCVTHSRSRQTVELLQYLYACGRERIALVGIGRSSINDLIKVDAALRYTLSLAHPVRRNDIYDWTECLEECISRFLPVCSRYDAVICPNDFAALTLIRHLEKNGIRVPKDLYVAGFSNQAVGRFSTPTITTITMDFSAIGRYAFSIWMQLQTLMEKDLVLKIIAPSRLLARGSTAFQQPEIALASVPFWQKDEKDQFYNDDTIQRLMRIESCLNRQDELDLRITKGILSNISYEELTDRLYISSSALHYRMAKIYRDVGCRTRAEFMALFKQYFGTFTLPEE